MVRIPFAPLQQLGPVKQDAVNGSGASRIVAFLVDDGTFPHYLILQIMRIGPSRWVRYLRMPSLLIP